MKQEPKDNIVEVCECCSKRLKKQWQDLHKNIHIQTSDFIKTEVREGTKGEHLWFQVQEVISPNLFIGKCANIPVDLDKLNEGDSRKIKFSEIEGHMSQDDMEQAKEDYYGK